MLPSYIARNFGLSLVEVPIDELASEVWPLTHQDMRRTPRIRAIVAAAAEGLRAAVSPGGDDV